MQSNNAEIILEELWSLLKKSPERIEDLLFSKDITEEHAILLAENPNTPPECLNLLAGLTKFRDSYRLKLAICKNPKTPHRITLSLLKFLRLFDLADLTRNYHIPINIRQKIEQILKEKIPSLPVGNLITLARRSSSAIIVSILENAKAYKGTPTLIKACLESPSLKEGDILKLINSHTTPLEVIHAIAKDPKWSTRYSIRYALIRNFYTPLSIIVNFLKDMKTYDLEELYKDEAVSISTRPFIYMELIKRINYLPEQ